MFENLAVSSTPLGTVAGFQLGAVFQSAGAAEVAAVTVVVASTTAQADVVLPSTTTTAVAADNIEKRFIAYLRVFKVASTECGFPTRARRRKATTNWIG